jgi:hypothetical protein
MWNKLYSHTQHTALPSLSELLQYSGTILVSSLSEPALHLPNAPAALLRQTIYNCLGGREPSVFD